MTSLRKLLLPAVLTSALVVASCSSGNKTTTDTASTTTTTTEAPTTTIAANTTVPATAAPVVTNPPATNPPTTAPQIITNFSVGNAAACPATDVPYTGPLPSVTVSWTVVGADSVNLEIDGGLWNSYGLSGSDTLPASCDGTGHNVHTYSVVAIKNGQQIAKKTATRGH